MRVKPYQHREFQSLVPANNPLMMMMTFFGREVLMGLLGVNGPLAVG